MHPRRCAPLLALALLATLIVACPPSSAANPHLQPQQQLPTSQLIVALRGPGALAGQAAPRPDQLAARLSADAGVELSYLRQLAGGAHLFALAGAGAEADAVAARLAASPLVAYAEPDYRVLAARTPSDSYYAPFMWHLKAVGGGSYGANLPQAWDITTGAPELVVAVIDSGALLTHRELAGRSPAGSAGYDFIGDLFNANDGDGRDGDPSDPGDWLTAAEANLASCGPARDSTWHGSHVAGTIGASANDGKGIAGINWASKLLHLRVTGKCGGYTSDLAEAIRWAAGLPVGGVPANLSPARVINLSLGGRSPCSSTLQSAITAALGAGSVIVVAAGNGAQSVANYAPANCSGVIAVAATSRDGGRAAYSNFGGAVAIAAPGGDFATDAGVLSSVSTGARGPAADGYGFYEGTSMAAPHVAGVVSLMLSANPALAPAQVLSILQSSATPFPAGSTCPTSGCGAGIVNAGAAVEEAARLVRTFGFASPAQAVNEDVGTVNIPVRLSVPSAQPISIPYSVDGTAGPDDVTLSAGTLVIPAGASEATISFSMLPDGADEGVETVIVTLGAPGGAPQRAVLRGEASHTVSIWDGSASVLDVSSIGLDEKQDAVTVSFTVMRQGSSATTAGLSYALFAERPGREVQLRTGAVSLEPGERAQTITLAIGRAELGLARSLVLRLSAPTGSTFLESGGTRQLDLAAPHTLALPLVVR